MRLFLPAAAALLVGAYAFGVPAPASAAVGAPGGVERPSDGIAEARMNRRKGMRRRGMGRTMAPSQAGNARNPSRPPQQQNQGQTTGGPRY